MIRLVLLLLASPALAAVPHSGEVAQRTSPELSDIALFVVAVIGVVLARRAMRARARRRAPPKD